MRLLLELFSLFALHISKAYLPKFRKENKSVIEYLIIRPSASSYKILDTVKKSLDSIESSCILEMSFQLILKKMDGA